ncbi:hypothetical protein A6C57_01170 [Fibrella sp. ES10-3-2-2]|nr:hypothetical protein A6C57_01170 [Fibrella sp. ES10-3-2-2]
MASILTGTPVTYAGEQAKEYTLIPALNVGGLELFFKVLTKVKVKQQVLLLGILDKITQADAGCGQGENSKAIPRSEKFWIPEDLKAWVSQCWKDLKSTFEEGMLNGGNGKADVSDTAIMDVVLPILISAAGRDLVRLAFLGNKTLVSGNMTSGVSAADYTGVNGIWKRILDGVGAATITRVTIAKNAATTLAGQVLDAGEAKTILQSVLRKSKTVLKQRDKKTLKFIVTRSIWENYEDYLIANDKLETAWMKMQDGSDQLQFMGIPLEIADVLDEYLAADFNPTGTAVTNPHRVILTVQDNLQVALDTDSNDPTAFDVWYEKKDEKVNARLTYKMDTQVAHDQLVTVAY